MKRNPSDERPCSVGFIRPSLAGVHADPIPELSRVKDELCPVSECSGAADYRENDTDRRELVEDLRDVITEYQVSPIPQLPAACFTRVQYYTAFSPTPSADIPDVGSGTSSPVPRVQDGPVAGGSHFGGQHSSSERILVFSMERAGFPGSRVDPMAQPLEFTRVFVVHNAISILQL